MKTRWHEAGWTHGVLSNSGRVGLGSLACELTLGTCYYPDFPINPIHLPALSEVFPLMIRGIEKSN